MLNPIIRYSNFMAGLSPVVDENARGAELCPPYPSIPVTILS